MQVLVTGGAGYIGSQMVRQLVEKKIDTVVIDSLENGHRGAVPASVPLFAGHTGDAKFLDDVFARYSFDAVIHFAAYLAVKESVEHPDKYFRNNIVGTLTLLETMLKHNVKRFVFSSTCATYGITTQVPIPENHPQHPINPYGESKLIVEQMLKWLDSSMGLRSIALRYFNASGAELDGSHGEDHPDEPHIIPVALYAVRNNKPFMIYGEDYNTRDGTCIRDYIHTIDLCNAHSVALDALMNGHATTAYNVGTGTGYSNKEIADAVRKVTGIDFEIKKGPRRPGDPDELVGDASKLRNDLGWSPHHSDIETIIGSAWKWHRLHPNGYADK